jgi:hypothetical protein
MGSTAPAGTNARKQRRRGRFTVGVRAGHRNRRSGADASFDAFRTRAARTAIIASVFALADAWQSAQLPNGVKLELECSERDVALVSAMIAAVGRR